MGVAAGGQQGAPAIVIGKAGNRARVAQIAGNEVGRKSVPPRLSVAKARRGMQKGESVLKTG